MFTTLNMLIYVCAKTMFDDLKYFQIGALWMNKGCTMELQCVVCQSCNRPVGEIVARASTCEDGYYCSSVNGVANCQIGMFTGCSI